MLASLRTSRTPQRCWMLNALEQGGGRSFQQVELCDSKKLYWWHPPSPLALMRPDDRSTRVNSTSVACLLALVVKARTITKNLFIYKVVFGIRVAASRRTSRERRGSSQVTDCISLPLWTPSPLTCVWTPTTRLNHDACCCCLTCVK